MKHLRKFNEEYKQREKINLSHIKDLKSLIHGENYALSGTDYEFVELIQTDFDGEKGYVDYHVIIKRISDGKYFRGYGDDWGRGEYNVHPNFEEVFPRQITKTVYE